MTQIEYCVWTLTNTDITILYPKEDWHNNSTDDTIGEANLIKALLGHSESSLIFVNDSHYVTLDDSLDPPPEEKVDRFDDILGDLE